MSIENCIQCNKCVNECLFLQKYGTPLEIKRKIESREYEQIIVYECSLCGLCNVVCPEKINIKELFFNLRVNIVKRGIGPLKAHKKIINFEKWAGSSLFKLYKIPVNANYLFFVGCALTGKPPKLIYKIYSILNRKLDNRVGIAIDCCYKISHDLGNIEKFNKKMNEKIEICLKKGINTIITVCPSCYEVFKKYTDFNIMFLYDFLSGKDFQVNKKLSIHDPCTLRDENEIHKRVREILKNSGAQLFEMKHKKDKTFCCGEGGGAGFVNREYSRAWKNKRISEAENDIVVYCYGCKNFLKNRKVKVFHIIDILFNDFEKITPVKFWLNRWKLKKKVSSLDVRR